MAYFNRNSLSTLIRLASVLSCLSSKSSKLEAKALMEFLIFFKQLCCYVSILDFHLLNNELMKINYIKLKNIYLNLVFSSGII